MLDVVCACKSLIEEAGWVLVSHAGDLLNCQRNGAGDWFESSLSGGASADELEGAGALGWGGAGVGVGIGVGWLKLIGLVVLSFCAFDGHGNQAGRFGNNHLASRRLGR